MARQKKLDFSPLDQALGYKIRRAQVLASQDLIRRFNGLDLTPVTFTLLNLIQKNPLQTQSALGAELGIARANMTSILNKLEQVGLVKRQPSPRDSRALAIAITKKGQLTLKKATEAWHSHDVEIRSALGDRESQALFSEQLDRLIERLQD